jgi:anti-anti-sigma factor
VSSDPKTASLLSIDERRVGDRVLLTAIGEVDISSVADLQLALEAVRDSDAAEIWLDFTPMTFMDCSGLRALLSLHASLQDADRRLVLICPPGPVLRLLVLTEVNRVLEIHPTFTAAQYAN